MPEVATVEARVLLHASAVVYVEIGGCSGYVSKMSVVSGLLELEATPIECMVEITLPKWLVESRFTRSNCNPQ
jgi:hypothetical protein